MYLGHRLLAVPELRPALDTLVTDVSTCCRDGTKFLQLWVARLWEGTGGAFPPELEWVDFDFDFTNDDE